VLCISVPKRRLTMMASARLDVHEIRKQLVKWARLVPYAFLLTTRDLFAFSRLRRVDGAVGASHTASSTESVPRWELAFRVRPGKWRLSDVYQGSQPSTCICITDALRPPWNWQLRDNCHRTRRGFVAKSPSALWPKFLG
jgi:hypothetical protein